MTVPRMRVWSSTVLMPAFSKRSRMVRSSSFCFSIDHTDWAYECGQSMPPMVVSHTARTSCLGCENAEVKNAVANINVANNFLIILVMCELFYFLDYKVIYFP